MNFNLTTVLLLVIIVIGVGYLVMKRRKKQN